MLLATDTIEQLFRQHHKMLCNAAYNITSDSEAAKDIVQDIFLKIWNKKNILQADSITKSYLYKSVVNTSLNHLEKNKRTQQIQPGTIEHIAPESGQPDQKITQQELREKIDNAIKLLPPKCKTVFVLSRFEDMKYRQIAEHLNISSKTVENQMSIALEKLRQQLRPYLTKEFLSIAFTAGISALLHLIALLLLANLLTELL